MSMSQQTFKLFTELLEASMLAYKVKPVRVMVVKDIGVLNVDGVDYELRRGTEIEVPRWLAEVLAEEGIVEILESGISLEDLARVHFNVHSARSIREVDQLPEDFYIQAKQYIEDLDLRIRRELNPMLLEEKQKAELYLVEVISKRLVLLLQALRSPASLAEIYEKLSSEEKLLAEALRDLIEEWRRRILGTG